jgi:hypothetical protein
MDILHGEGAASVRHVCGQHCLSLLQMTATPLTSARVKYCTMALHIKRIQLRLQTRITNSLEQRLRWSRGCVLASSTQVRGFKPGLSPRIFQGEKNPQHAFLPRGSKAGGPMS